MREIKFRGISVDTNEWVYGHFWDMPLVYGHRPKIYVEDSPDEHTDDTGFVIIKRETLGQYTGIKFNDVELYEGDIIEWYQRPEGYPQDPNKVRKTKVIELSNLIAGCFLYNFYDYKVIGNIHQNSDLL